MSLQNVIIKHSGLNIRTEDTQLNRCFLIWLNMCIESRDLFALAGVFSVRLSSPFFGFYISKLVSHIETLEHGVLHMTRHLEAYIEIYDDEQ